MHRSAAGWRPAHLSTPGRRLTHSPRPGEPWPAGSGSAEPPSGQLALTLRSVPVRAASTSPRCGKQRAVSGQNGLRGWSAPAGAQGAGCCGDGAARFGLATRPDEPPCRQHSPPHANDGSLGRAGARSCSRERGPFDPHHRWQGHRGDDPRGAEGARRRAHGQGGQGSRPRRHPGGRPPRQCHVRPYEAQGLRRGESCSAAAHVVARPRRSSPAPVTTSPSRLCDPCSRRLFVAPWALLCSPPVLGAGGNRRLRREPPRGSVGGRNCGGCPSCQRRRARSRHPGSGERSPPGRATAARGVGGLLQPRCFLVLCRLQRHRWRASGRSSLLSSRCESFARGWRLAGPSPALPAPPTLTWLRALAISQLPLPEHVNEMRVLSEISPEKDVDGLHPANVGDLALRGRNPRFVACTPRVRAGSRGVCAALGRLPPLAGLARSSAAVERFAIEAACSTFVCRLAGLHRAAPQEWHRDQRQVGSGAGPVEHRGHPSSSPAAAGERHRDCVPQPHQGHRSPHSRRRHPCGGYWQGALRPRLVDQARSSCH